MTIKPYRVFSNNLDTKLSTEHAQNKCSCRFNVEISCLVHFFE